MICDSVRLRPTAV